MYVHMYILHYVDILCITVHYREKLREGFSASFKTSITNIESRADYNVLCRHINIIETTHTYSTEQAAYVCLYVIIKNA